MENNIYSGLMTLEDQLWVVKFKVVFECDSSPRGNTSSGRLETHWKPTDFSHLFQELKRLFKKGFWFSDGFMSEAVIKRVGSFSFSRVLFRTSVETLEFVCGISKVCKQKNRLEWVMVFHWIGKRQQIKIMLFYQEFWYIQRFLYPLF